MWQGKDEILQRNLRHDFLLRYWNNNILQRKVGFEFQTIGGNWNVYKKTERGYEVPGHGEHIDNFKSMKVETDGADLEFITPPIDENDKNSVSSMASKTENAFSLFIQHVASQLNKKRTAIDSSSCYEYKGFYINLNGNTTAHPQATVGVKMENIIDLLDKITNIPIQDRGSVFGHTTFYKTNASSSTSSANAADRQRRAVKDSVTSAKTETKNSKVQGFIALIEHFIKVNEDAMLYKDNNSYNINAKNKMPVMPRTSLKELYNVLSENEKEEIIKYLNRKSPEMVVMYQESLYKGMDSQGKPVFEYPKGGNRYTIEDLKNDLLYDQNNFSERRYSGIGNGIIITDKYNRKKIIFFEEQSSFSQISNVKKAIFELRSLPNLVPQDQWGDVVIAVANLIKKVNEITHLPPISKKIKKSEQTTFANRNYR